MTRDKQYFEAEKQFTYELRLIINSLSIREVITLTQALHALDDTAAAGFILETLAEEREAELRAAYEPAQARIRRDHDDTMNTLRNVR